MFGNNPIAKREPSHGSHLTVVDGMPFYTIQGEGPYAGHPAMFLRLHGCPLQCFFCDTHFSNPSDPSLDIKHIVDLMEGMWPANTREGKLAVITGGEPTRQTLDKIITRLHRQDWIVQIETAGIFWQECLRNVDIVVSPKTPKVHDEISFHAKCFKYVIRAGEVDPEDGLPLTNTQVAGGSPARLARPKHEGIPIYLSPMDEGDEARNFLNRRAVAESAMKFGYIAGLQLHKFMDLA